MRIGILTFHRGNNYGGILQCYALQQVLKEQGHSVEIINFYPKIGGNFLRRVYAKFATADSMKSLLLSLRDFIGGRKKLRQYDKEINAASVKVFDNFRSQYLQISKELNDVTIGDYANVNYDLIITGSDQVWTSLFDEPLAYMLDWMPLFKGKRMSYAACSAHKTIRGSQKKRIQNCLSKFELITVRDKTTQCLVKKVLGEMPQIVPDPSLLYSYEEFINKGNIEPYILTYILGGEIEGGHELALQKIRKQVGNLPVYSIVIPCNSQDIVKYADKVFQTLSPKEWVNMFYHAKYVYTDSFHAIMFSLKFQKPFAAYYCDKIRSSRLIDLKYSGIDNIYMKASDIKEDAIIYSEDILKKGFDLKKLLSNI